MAQSRAASKALPLDERAALIGHLDRPRIGKAVQLPRLWIALRIGREISGHVLDELARGRAQTGGEQHGGEVRSAAAERHDAVTEASRQKARRDDHVVWFEKSQQPQPTQPRTPGALFPVGVRQTGLMNVGRRGADRRARADEAPAGRPIAFLRLTTADPPSTDPVRPRCRAPSRAARRSRRSPPRRRRQDARRAASTADRRHERPRGGRPAGLSAPSRRS